MRLIIDRFEGLYAVCEDDNENIVNILISALPENAAEGSVLNSDDNVITLDNTETAQRAERVKNKMNELFEK